MKNASTIKFGQPEIASSNVNDLFFTVYQTFWDYLKLKHALDCSVFPI